MIRRVLSRQNKEPRVFAFIDNQNLNLGVQRMGWKMDWRKYRAFLKEEYNVEQAYMFIGYMQEHEDLYKQMYDAGYNVILKPTVGMFASAEERAESDSAPKGNVDTDLVLEAMRQWRKYDKAIVVSGDGDFYGLLEHLEDKGKLLHIMTPNWKYSSLLKRFESKIVRIDKLRAQLAYRDRRKKPGNKNKQGKNYSSNQQNKEAKPKNRGHKRPSTKRRAQDKK